MVAGWVVLPPYLGPSLATEALVEVVDHVVPAVLVFAISLSAAARGAQARGWVMYGAGLTVVLAGLWMVATHVPLLVQAAGGIVGWVPALWHFAPGPAVMAVGGAWALHWHGDEAATADAAGGESAGT